MAQTFSPIKAIRDKQIYEYTQIVKQDLSVMKPYETQKIQNLFERVSKRLFLEGETKMPELLVLYFSEAMYGDEGYKHQEEFAMPREYFEVPGMEQPKSILPVARQKQVNQNAQRFDIYQKISKGTVKDLIDAYEKLLKDAQANQSAPDAYVLDCISDALQNSLRAENQNGKNLDADMVSNILAHAGMIKLDFSGKKKDVQQAIFDSLAFVKFFKANASELGHDGESVFDQSQNADKRLAIFKKELESLEEKNQTKGKFYEYICSNKAKYESIVQTNSIQAAKLAEANRKAKEKAELQEKRAKAAEARDKLPATNEYDKKIMADLKSEARLGAEASGMDAGAYSSATPLPDRNTPEGSPNYNDFEVRSLDD